MSFFASGPNYNKLRSNLRLVINRLKLLEKKKTEIALKARKEIADYIQMGKDDRGRIRVEHIIREDYLVEAMELIEMYADLLLARFGIIQTMKEVDPGLEEAIATIIWVTPRLQSDVPEFKAVSDQFTAKYGKVFCEACRADTLENVSEKVKHKLDVRPPPKMLIERYMIEIAKSYNVPFEPDALVMREADAPLEGDLLDMGDDNRRPPGGPGGFGGGGGGGFGGKCSVDLPYNPNSNMGANSGPIPYPPSGGLGYPGAQSDSSGFGGGFNMGPPNPGFGMSSPPPAGFSLPPPYEPPGPESKVPPTAYSSPPEGPQAPMPPPPPAPAAPPVGPPSVPPVAGPPGSASLGLPDLPDVPVSPGHSAAPSDHEDSGPTDFDDLSKRFEELKRRK